MGVTGLGQLVLEYFSSWLSATYIAVIQHQCPALA
jgi:hypothetical protein